MIYFDTSYLIKCYQAELGHQQVRQLAQALRPQLKTIRRQTRDEEAAILKQLSDQVRPVLSAEQRTKLDALQNVVAGTHNDFGMVRPGINFAF